MSTRKNVRLIARASFTILASLYSGGDWFESGFFGNRRGPLYLGVICIILSLDICDLALCVLSSCFMRMITTVLFLLIELLLVSVCLG